MSRVEGFNKARFPICGSTTGQSIGQMQGNGSNAFSVNCILGVCCNNFQGSQAPRVRNAQYVSFVML